MTETCTDEDRCQVRKGCSNRRNWPVQDSFYCRSTSPRKHRTHLHPTRRPAVRCPSTSTQSPGMARGAAWPASLQGRRSSNTQRYHSRQRTRPLVSQPQSLRWLCLGTTYHTVNSSPSNNHSERDHRKVCRTSYSISMTFHDLGLIPKLSRPGKWDLLHYTVRLGGTTATGSKPEARRLNISVCYGCKNQGRYWGFISVLLKQWLVATINYENKCSERCKHCMRAGCSKVRTPPARPLQTCKHTDRTDYNTLHHS